MIFLCFYAAILSTIRLLIYKNSEIDKIPCFNFFKRTWKKGFDSKNTECRKFCVKKRTKPQMPDLMEAIFDCGYLLFDLIAGILFFVFSKGNPLFILYGVLTLTLCGGDAFHLVPRVIRTVRGSEMLFLL